MNKLWNLYRKKIDETQHLAGLTKGGTNAREAGIVPPVVTPRPLKMCENQERTACVGGICGRSHRGRRTARGKSTHYWENEKDQDGHPELS